MGRTGRYAGITTVCLGLALPGTGVPAGAVPAATPAYTVSTQSDVDDAGACGTDRTTGTGPDRRLSLREAVCEARNAGTATVSVPAGHFRLTAGPLLIEAPDAPVDVTVTGAGPAATVLDGAGASRVFELGRQGAAVTLSLGTLAVTGGRAAGGAEPGGGAVLAGGPDTVRLSDCLVRGNDGGPAGGAVLMTGGHLSIARCTFDRNTAGSGGALAWRAAAATDAMVVTGTAFVANAARGDTPGGGAILIGRGVPAGAVRITGARFDRNVARGVSAARGGAVYAVSGDPVVTGSVFTGNAAVVVNAALRSRVDGQGGALHLSAGRVSGSRIVGNSGPAVYSAGAGVRAAHDWWGCNAGPGTPGCDRVAGRVGPDPWLTLTATAAPSTVVAPATAAVTAGFGTDSAGVAVPAADRAAMAGTVVAWATSAGTLAAARSVVAATGTAATSYLPARGGNQRVRVRVDNARAVTTVLVAERPTVARQPLDRYAATGRYAVFRAAAAGLPAPEVRWQRSTDHGVRWADLPGATRDQLAIPARQAADGSLYRARYTNLAGATLTGPAALHVLTVPHISLNPADEAATPGDTVTFTAAAVGTPAPAARWQLSTPDSPTWTDIPGATDTTLTAGATDAADGNRYRAVFTNPAFSAATAAATLTVTDVPPISTDPTDQTVLLGQPVTFTAATSDTTATVQWQTSYGSTTGWGYIAAATSPTLSFTPTADQDGWRYRAVFTNSAGANPTAAATLSVHVAPAVERQPDRPYGKVGDTVDTFAIASGQPEPTVQWQESPDGTAWTPVAGASHEQLTFTLTRANARHYFRAVFTNVAGSVTTDAVTVYVLVSPVVTIQPAGKRVTVGETVTFTASATGVPRPDAIWQGSTDRGRSWGELAARPTTTPVGSTGVRTTLTSPSGGGDNGLRVRAVFSNDAGTLASTQATLTVLTKPVVVAPPRQFHVSTGGHVDFYVVMNSALKVTIAWQVSVDGGKHWANLPNQHGTHLLFTAAGHMNGWRYRAVLSNDLGRAVTQSAILTVVSPFGTALPASRTGASPGTGTGTSPPRATLPNTGTDPTGPLRLAATLLAAGIAVLVSGRRRRPPTAE